MLSAALQWDDGADLRQVLSNARFATADSGVDIDKTLADGGEFAVDAKPDAGKVKVYLAAVAGRPERRIDRRNARGEAECGVNDSAPPVAP